MVKMNSIRIFLFLAANLEWPLHQFGVKNAFLHGDLEEVYMDVPLGFVDTKTRAWFDCFSQAMLIYGFL